MSDVDDEGYLARMDAAHLAVQAAATLDDDVSAATIFSLAIFFESWLLNGGDATQEKLKLLPQDEAKVLKFVPKGS